MSPRSKCPDPELFERLCLEELSPVEAEQFARHLEECPTCGNRLENLEVNESLVKAIRAGTSLDDSGKGEVLSCLIQGIKELPQPVSAPAGATAEQVSVETPLTDEEDSEKERRLALAAAARANGREPT